MPAVPADANALVLLPLRTARAHRVDDACYFMSWNPRILDSGPGAFFREHVTVADTTGLNLDPHLSRLRLGNLALDDLEISTGSSDLRYLHWGRCWRWGYSERCHKSSWELACYV